MKPSEKLESLVPKKFKEKCKQEMEYIKKQHLADYFITIKRAKVIVQNTCNSWVAYAIGITRQKPKGDLRLVPDYVSLPD